MWLPLNYYLNYMLTSLRFHPKYKARQRAHTKHNDYVQHIYILWILADLSEFSVGVLSAGWPLVSSNELRKFQFVQMRAAYCCQQPACCGSSKRRPGVFEWDGRTSGAGAPFSYNFKARIFIFIFEVPHRETFAIRWLRSSDQFYSSAIASLCIWNSKI